MASLLVLQVLAEEAAAFNLRFRSFLKCWRWRKRNLLDNRFCQIAAVQVLVHGVVLGSPCSSNGIDDFDVG